MRKKCLYLELFCWSAFFPHSDWIRWDTEYPSVFSPDLGKCRKNAEQNNSDYGLLLRSDSQLFLYEKDTCILICRLGFGQFLDLRGNLGNLKKKLTRKTYFSREKKRLASHIYLVKFCQAAFLWCQRSFYCIFVKNRC